MDEKFFNQKILPISNSTHCLLFSMTQQHTYTHILWTERTELLTHIGIGIKFFFQVYKVYSQCYLVIIYQSTIIIFFYCNLRTKQQTNKNQDQINIFTNCFPFILDIIIYYLVSLFGKIFSFFLMNLIIIRSFIWWI